MYTFDSRIRYSETDQNAVLTIEALIDYFQDCSTFQTQDAGAGLDWLKAQGLAWVLSYWQIDIMRLPRLYDHVRVGTIPYELRGFLGLRNFFMDSMEPEGAVPGKPAKSKTAGERLALANSVWALMDMDGMTPARVSEEHLSLYTLGERLPMTYLDRKIRIPADGETAEAEPVIVHRSHLDTNHHVNNGQYVRIALEALEAVRERVEESVLFAKDGSALPGKNIRIRAEYKKQAHLNDVLVPVISLYGESDDRKLAVDLRLNGESACVTELSVLS